VKAFVTKDTSFKDDLRIPGISFSKGSGRIQFLHYFSKLHIFSTYLDGDTIKSRCLDFNESSKEINEDSFSVRDKVRGPIETKFVLDKLKPQVNKKVIGKKDLLKMFAASELKNYIMVHFLPKLITLKNVLHDFQVQFVSLYKGIKQEEILIPLDLPDLTDLKKLTISYKPSYENDEPGFEEFSIEHYKLDRARYSIPSNVIALCAKSSIVKRMTKRYVKTKHLENNPIEGFFHVILVESDYLDRHVNEQRTDFDIPENAQSQDALQQGLISYEEIEEGLSEVISAMLAPPDWDRAKIVARATEKYGVSATMIADVDVRVHFGDTEDTVAARVLNAYQGRIIKDTSEIFDLKNSKFFR
jgi:hypothetical protein